MNLLLFREEELSQDSKLELSDRRLKHLNQILGSQVGDSLRVGMVGGQTGNAVVDRIDNTEAQLSVTLQNDPPPPLDLIVILALPRPKMLRRILRGLTEVGVKEIHLINSYRVEKSFWQSPLLDAGKIEAVLLEGLEQSMDTQLPVVNLAKRFRPFVEDQLPQLCEGRQSLLADHGGTARFPSEPGKPGLLIIGPEGGFIPFEVDLLCQAGAEAVSLGERVLRVETAISAALGKYLY